MKAIIFHGTGCKPEEFWYGWLKKELERTGYQVVLPHYPEINREPISQFLPKVLKKHTFDEEIVLVGHSAGASLLLSILENIDAVIPKAILVAGFVRPLPSTPKSGEPILQDSYDWDKIKAHVKDVYFVNSTNDPWGCDDKQGRIMFDHLGGTQIIRNDGHFGSVSMNQPYPEFPLLRVLTLGAKA